MKIVAIFSLSLILFSSMVFAQDRYPFANPKREQQFKRLTNDMRCMVCQNESLATSTSGFAEDMRNEIYNMVKQGKSDREIIRFMEARYGYFVSFKPPFNWETFLLWFTPLLLLILAFFIGRLVHQKYRARE